MSYYTATLRFELQVAYETGGSAVAWLDIQPSRARQGVFLRFVRDTRIGNWRIDDTENTWNARSLLYRSTLMMRTPDLDKLVDAVMADLVGCERRHA